ncbi:hypothetical protein K7432_002666 [Basidiobolus ranarum]|uniref:Solute carrier family 40 member n=1 Tax=Basidiobolus ranarum TaxID=34480 RepID=A0ABR2W7E6_9FUNG
MSVEGQKIKSDDAFEHHSDAVGSLDARHKVPTKTYLWLFAFQLLKHVHDLLPLKTWSPYWIGKWVDYVARYTAALVAIPIKRMSVAIMCLGFWFLLSKYNFANDSDKSVIYGVFGVIVLFASVLKVATISLSIAIDRDWVVILTKGNSSALTTVNTNMRRIDLISKFATPLLFGFLSTSQGVIFCVGLTGFWNLASMIPEFLIIRHVYKLVPELSQSKVLEEEHSDEKNNTDSKMGVLSRFYHASLAYSMIYMSVLSIAGTMVSYLSWKGYSEYVIGIMRSLMTALAFLGTFVMPIMKRFLGVYRTARASIWIEVASLIPVIVSFFLAQNKLSAVLLFGGISLSRLGVWVFDLSQTQIMQERVENAQAGLINGWQYSLTNVFDLGQFLLTMIWSDPRQFHIPAVISFVMVVLAAITFTSQYHKVARGTINAQPLN